MEEQKRKLRVFEMSVLRKIFGITRRDRRRNSDVMKELVIEKDIVQVLQTCRLTYFGHVNRMHTDGHGHHPKERPRKKWIDNIREDCAEMASHLLTSDNRTSWRNTVQHMGCHRHRRNGNKSK